MKKVLLSSILLAGLCFGASVDGNNAKINWTGFKFANKTGVKGSFSDVKFKFSKQNGSLAEILTGSTAKIDLKKVATGNPVSEENLTKGFFANFEGKDIRAKIESVMEGENQGTILLKVTMNKKSQLVPMQYTIENNTLVAKGMIDILSFKLDKALEGLKQACGELHEGYTWTQVEIGFELPIQQ